MNEWMNERTNERTNERMNEWMNEWMNERTNERTNEWMNGYPKTDLDQLRKRWDRICGRRTVQTQSKHYVSLCRKYLAVISLTLQPSSRHMYRTVVTIGAASLTFSNSTFCPHSVFMCFVWIWEQTAIFFFKCVIPVVCCNQKGWGHVKTQPTGLLVYCVYGDYMFRPLCWAETQCW